MKEYKIRFVFRKYPETVLLAYVSAEDEKKAANKFAEDYPHLDDVEVIEVINLSAGVEE